MILPTVVYQAVRRVQLPQLSVLPMMPIPRGKGSWWSGVADGHDPGVEQDVQMEIESEGGALVQVQPEAEGPGGNAREGWWSGGAGAARDGEEVILGGGQVG